MLFFSTGSRGPKIVPVGIVPSGTVKMCLNIVEHRESHKGVGSVPQACLVL